MFSMSKMHHGEGAAMFGGLVLKTKHIASGSLRDNSGSLTPKGEKTDPPVL